ncbi:hypothetical protein [Tenacibaculum jejuense]|uniref:Uncharacterized protein n=1 Tax=Tenacibaculum jejuense TaxID=584609 RepID=A0A238U4V1_9FLAO|nr:hypothetical protein [Tenacibaculum jejuense]SNR14167.1 protein of unknown function [Tenacibaculum jejuense]
MQKTLLFIIPIIFAFSMILISASSPASIIEKSGYNDILENKPFYGIKHMRKVISLNSNRDVIKNLKRKILIRKIGYSLLISTPLLMMLNAIISR